MRSPSPGPVRIGIIGVGAMGRELLYQSRLNPGVETVAVCDRDLSRCTGALAWMKLPHRVVDSPRGVEEAVARGEVAVCEDGRLLAECPLLEAVVESSSSVASAIGPAHSALRHGKHLILMNSELDLTFGPLLAREARAHGVVCTSADGDQHGVLARVLRDLARWGFAPVMAGNIKGFLDRRADPTSIAPEADKRRLDHRMCAAFTDGSKLNIEMALVANAFGMRTPAPGMTGPRAARVEEVLTLFDFDRLWGGGAPLVDYILGAEPGGGVFAVGHCDDPYQRGMMAYYKMGDGPFYLFTRPYHLCHIEAMETVLDAAAGRALLTPDHGFSTNVFAYAKRDLKAGERLDGVGGYTCYGLIENTADDAADPGIPLCLAEDVVLTRPVPRDGKIPLADIRRDPAREEFRLFAEAVAAGAVPA